MSIYFDYSTAKVSLELENRWNGQCIANLQTAAKRANNFPSSFLSFVLPLFSFNFYNTPSLNYRSVQQLFALCVEK
jgi:hypothetical protein